MRTPRKKKSQTSRPRQAQQADKHVLYEEAVQCAEAEIDFVDQTFRELRGRQATLLREDFCGTANSSCEWVRRRPTNRAIGVDLDAEVQQWGREHHIAKLDADQQERIQLIHANVLEVETEPVDAVLAMNFSYWIFKERTLLKQYFERVHAALKEDGVLFMDCFGGYEALQELRESRKCDGFTYIWDQVRYNPITGDLLCKIHFSFPDGSRRNSAFVYDWRLWSLPELQDLLIEVGFKPSIYWEGADQDGEGNGEFTRTREGEADAGWITYIVAER